MTLSQIPRGPRSNIPFLSDATFAESEFLTATFHTFVFLPPLTSVLLVSSTIPLGSNVSGRSATTDTELYDTGIRVGVAQSR